MAEFFVLRLTFVFSLFFSFYIFISVRKKERKTNKQTTMNRAKDLCHHPSIRLSISTYISHFFYYHL